MNSDIRDQICLGRFKLVCLAMSNTVSPTQSTIQCITAVCIYSKNIKHVNVCEAVNMLSDRSDFQTSSWERKSMQNNIKSGFSSRELLNLNIIELR